MPITYKSFDVAFLVDGEPVETEVTVYKVDELRAELTGRRMGLRSQTVLDKGGEKVVDLGDHNNIDALEIWSALVRTGQYAGKAEDFRLRDCLAFERQKTADDRPKETPADPTRPVTNTGSGSPVQPSSETPTSG